MENQEQKQPTLGDALNIVAEVCSRHNGPLAEHQTIQAALRMLHDGLPLGAAQAGKSEISESSQNDTES